MVPRYIAILFFVLVAMSMYMSMEHAYMQSFGVLLWVEWTRYLNITMDIDNAYGVCLFDNNVAVVGEIFGSPGVGLFNRSSGSLIGLWRGMVGGVFVDCVSVGGKLYVVGYDSSSGNGYIYVFDDKLNVVKSIEIPGVSLYSIVYSDGYIYAGGSKGSFGYIEKRSLDLDLVKSIEIKTEDVWSSGEINAIGINPATDDVWVVGFYTDSKNIGHSLIAILNKDLEIVKQIDYSALDKNYMFTPYSITFDENGYAYVSCFGVAKFDPSGNLDKYISYPISMAGSKIVYVNGYLYVFEQRFLGNSNKHVVDVLDKDLNMLSLYVLSSNIEADSLFGRGKAVANGSNIYVAGYDYAYGKTNTRWVIYSISTLYPVQQTVMTKTITSTAIQTISIPITITTTSISPTTITSIVTTTISTAITSAERTITITTTATVTAPTTLTETILTTFISPTTITTTVTTTIKEAVIPTEYVVAIVIAVVVLAIAMVYILRLRKK